MSTKIEWTDESWSPVVGCTKVSAGCQNCYAEKMAYRLWCMGSGVYGSVLDINTNKWSGDIYCRDRKTLEIPLHWRKPRRIFVVSMGDLFHEAVPFGFIDKVVGVAKKCPQHILQILTKRADVMLTYAQSCRKCSWPENIIGMVTAENQAMADLRIPYLLQCGFKTTGVSVEPMLEPVALTKNWVDYLVGWTTEAEAIPDGHGGIEPSPIQVQTEKLDWVIIGCESINGKAGRFCEDEQKWWDAARNIIEQCKAAGVLVFMKQGPINGKVEHNISKFPEWARIRQMPKEK